MVKVREKKTGRTCEAILKKNDFIKCFEKMYELKKFEDLKEHHASYEAACDLINNSDYNNHVIVIEKWVKVIPRVLPIDKKTFEEDWEIV